MSVVTSSVVIEQAPHVQRLTYFGSPYRVPLPYVQYQLEFCDQRQWRYNTAPFGADLFRVTVAAKTARYRSSPVCALPLPNVYGHDDRYSYEVCFGSSQRGEGTTIPQALINAINAFWESDFNDDGDFEYDPAWLAIQQRGHAAGDNVWGSGRVLQWWEDHLTIADMASLPYAQLGSRQEALGL